MFNKSSIRYQIILSLFLPLLLIGGGLLIFVTIDNHQVMTHYNEQKMSSKLDIYATQLSTILTQIESDGTSIQNYATQVFMPAYTNGSEKGINNAMSAFDQFLRNTSQTHNDMLYYIYFLPQTQSYGDSFGYGDLNADQQLDSLPIPPRTYFTQGILDEDKQWYFNVFKSNSPQWFGPYQKPNLPQVGAVLTYTLPIYLNDNIVAVIGIDYPLTALKDELSTMTYYDTGYIAIMDKQLKFVSHPTLTFGKTITEQLGESYRFIETILSTSESGMLSYRWFDDRDKVLIFKKLPNNWKIILTAYSDEVFSQNKVMNQRLILLFILSLITMIAFSAIFGHRISKPLIRLTEAISEGSEKRLEVIKQIGRRSDEIGELARLLHKHLRYNEKSLTLLHQYNNHLDEMVALRNEALVSANSELSQRRDMIQKRQETLRLQNTNLEKSIQSMVSTERQLVNQEKIASYQNIISKVASEIKRPLTMAHETLIRLEQIANTLKQTLLSQPTNIYFLRELGDDCQKNNRQLLSNLIFSKDIIDYIKDLSSNKDLNNSTIELNDYLLKVKALLNSLPIENSIQLELPALNPVYLELDAVKFLHLLNSLAIHIVTRVQDPKTDIDITIQVNVQDTSLSLVISDATCENCVSATNDNLNYYDSEYSALGFSMIELVMNEAFNGTLSIVTHEGNTPITTYTLYFPQVVVVEKL